MEVELVPESEVAVSAKPRLDERNIEVLAGDVHKGFWLFDGNAMNAPADSGPRPPVELVQNIKEINVRLKRKINNLDLDVPASHIIGMINGQLLGPLGGLATHVVTGVAGSSEFICVGCELKDGRKFIAWMHGDVYKKWEKLHSDANPAPPVEAGAEVKS